MTHVTHPIFVTHLTHDPWPIDPFPALIRNIAAKKISKSIHVRQSYSKPKVGRFFWDTEYILFACFLGFPNLLPFLIAEEGEASPSIGNILWRVWMTFTRSAITQPEVNGFGWNLGHSGVNCLELAVTDFGRDPRKSKSGSACWFFVFFWGRIAVLRT